MKRQFWRRTPEALLGVMLLAGGCAPDNSVKPGAPVLLTLAVYGNTDSNSRTPLALEDDAGAVAVPGFVHVTARFDRLLDPNGLIVIDGGAEVGVELATVTATPGPPPPWTSIYTHNGGDPTLALAYAPGPNIVVACGPTFPSGATITVALVKAKLHSRGGEPFTGEGTLVDGTLTFQTQPFGATIAVPADATSPATVAFNNLPSDTATAAITMLANGAAFTDFTISPDPMGNPTIFDVAPGTTWPAGATMQIDVGVGATNALDAPLAAPATATFTVGS